MILLTSLEKYNSNFDLYIFPNSKKGGIRYQNVKDEMRLRKTWKLQISQPPIYTMKH